MKIKTRIIFILLCGLISIFLLNSIWYGTVLKHREYNRFISRVHDISADAYKLKLLADRYKAEKNFTDRLLLTSFQKFKSKTFYFFMNTDLAANQENELEDIKNKLINNIESVELFLSKLTDVVTEFDDDLSLEFENKINRLLGLIESEFNKMIIYYENNMKEHEKSRFMLIIFIVVLLSLLFVYVIMKSYSIIRNRIDEISRVVLKIGDGQFELKINEIDDEFLKISRSINMMSVNLKNSIEKEKTVVLKAHETEIRKILELEEHESRLVAILKNIGEGVIAVDTNGNVVMMNYVAEDMTGIFGGEGMFIGNILELLDEKTRKKISNPVLDVLNKPRYLELGGYQLLKNASGWLFPVSVIATPVYVNNETVGAVVVFRDVTEERNMEKTLTSAKQEAENASVEKSLFLANMSHEIRTPINGIIGMSELLRETELDSTQDELVTVLSSETVSLLNLVNNILDFSKLEAGKLDLENIEFSLNSLTKSMMKSMAVSARKKGLDFYVFQDPTMPFNLVGDPDKIRQCLINLLTNAVKFTSVGEIIMNIKPVEIKKDRMTALFEVIDSGVGIDESKIKKIFDSFSQEDVSTTRKYGGTGLGLSIFKSLVELMGGRFGVESIKDKGSKFWFELDFEISGKKIFDEEFEFNETNLAVISKSKRLSSILDSYLTNIGVKFHIFNIEDRDVDIDNIEENPEWDSILIDMGRSRKEDFKDLDRIITNPKFKRLKKVLLTYPDYFFDKEFLSSRGILGNISKPVCRFNLLSMMYAVSEDLEADIFMEQFSDNEDLTATEAGNEEANILLVDDYPVNQTVALRHLVRSGYTVDIAENGEQAVEMYSTNDYDLVLMDVQMPIMDGFQATKHIRDYEKAALRDRTPVVALTAHVGDSYREKCLANDMDDYLSKPLRKISLINMVKKWLSGNDSSEESVVSAEPDAPSILNVEKLVEEFDGDKEFAMETVGDFIELAKEKVNEIVENIDNLDFQSLQENVHDIKGGARTIVAESTADAALALENAAKAQDIEECHNQFKLMTEALENLEKFIK